MGDARELLLTGDFDAADFRSVKLKTEKQIVVLESRLPEISKALTNIHTELTKGISNLQKAENQFKTGNMKVNLDILAQLN